MQDPSPVSMSPFPELAPLCRLGRETSGEESAMSERPIPDPRDVIDDAFREIAISLAGFVAVRDLPIADVRILIGDLDAARSRALRRLEGRRAPAPDPEIDRFLDKLTPER